MTRILSTYSLNSVIVLAHLCVSIKEILKEDISPDEKKYLKYISTYSDKYFRAVKERINESSNDRLRRKVENYVPELVPIAGKKRVLLEEDDFNDLSEILIEYNCKDCPGIEGCAIEKAFHDAFIPELEIIGKENRKCLYSYTDDDLYDTVRIKEKDDSRFISNVKKAKAKSVEKRKSAKKKRR